VFTWIKEHTLLLAALLYAGALAIAGHYEAAVGVALAALSGGLKEIPLPKAPPPPAA
jgi:hypothetical protein